MNMYLPGEVLNQEVIAGYSDVKPANEGSLIYAVNNMPGMVARNATRIQLGCDIPPVDEDLAEALFRLSAEYGIEFPGIGCLAVREDAIPELPQAGYTYTTSHVVSGINMHKGMAELPFDVLIGTMDKMLTYYEDMSRDFSGRLYLADLSLRQCMYGRVHGYGAVDDSRPDVYFVDYDRRLSNISKILFSEPRVVFGAGFGGIAGLDDDLYALKTNYPDQDFDHVASRLLHIANHQGIFYKVPTAYYHIEGVPALSA